MKIVGLLSWYDESPTWLQACVTSVAPILDGLVAVDGAYALFPGAAEKPNSSVAEVDAIAEACDLAGLPLTLHRRSEPFAGNEVEKRNLTLELARTFGLSQEDWLIVVDADLVLRHHSERLREALETEAHEYASADYGYFNSLDKQGVWDRTGVDAEQQRAPLRSRAMYRAFPTLRYETSHWCLAADDESGHKFYLYGDGKVHQPQLNAFDASSLIVFEHRSTERVTSRVNDARNYYTMREAAKIEHPQRTIVAEGLDGQFLPVRGA